MPRIVVRFQESQFNMEKSTCLWRFIGKICKPFCLFDNAIGEYVLNGTCTIIIGKNSRKYIQTYLIAPCKRNRCICILFKITKYSKLLQCSVSYYQNEFERSVTKAEEDAVYETVEAY